MLINITLNIQDCLICYVLASLLFFSHFVFKKKSLLVQKRYIAAEPMKEFELIYDPEESPTLCIFNNIDIENLTEPLIMQREEGITEKEEVHYKKKSEVVTYEPEGYTQLLQEEQEPLVITDSESRAFSGKLQDTSTNSGIYFAMINTGNGLKLLPIKKWYRFIQRNAFSDGDVEKLEKKIKNDENEEEANESDNEIDFEQTFDDDERTDKVLVIEHKKGLTNEGEKLQGLVENYDSEDKKDVKKAEENELVKESDQKRIKREAPELTKKFIKEIIGKSSITVKELLKKISKEFSLGEYEKKIIREFIQEMCVFAGQTALGEKLFKLKQD